jgi:hypothetical protein
MNELRGSQYLLFGGGYLRDLWRLPPFVGKKVYAFAELEVGRMYAGPSPSGSGPGSVWGDTGHRRWFFKPGRFFWRPAAERSADGT